MLTLSGSGFDGSGSAAVQDDGAQVRIVREDSRRVLEYGDYRDPLEHVRQKISTRERTRRLALALADLAVLLSAFAVTRFADPGRKLDYALLALLPLWVMLNKLLGLYDRDAIVIDKSTLNELPRIVESLAIGGAVIFLFAPLVGLEVHRHQALEFILLGAALMTLVRWGVRKLILHLTGPERAVIIGSGSVTRLLTRKLVAHPGYGIEVVGYIDVGKSEDGAEEDCGPLLGDLSCFREVCQELGVERVVIAFSSLDHEHLLDTIRASNALGLKLSIVPRLFEVLGRSLVVDEVEGMSMLSVRGLTRPRSALVAKRAIDVAGALLALLALFPLIVVIAAAIKLTSRGPVVFGQTRIGHGNRPFQMYKFRTMVDGADRLKHQFAHLNEAAYPMFKIAEDPRVTRVGRLLRRAFLDELPQLWNVLRGEMSLVGPRPLVPAEDAKVLGWHRQRLDLTPGLTGPWQVLGRTAIPFQEMVKLDYRYVADWSLWNDIRLLARTVPLVLRRRGV